MSKQVEELEKEKNELDHIERAKRIENIPLLEVKNAGVKEEARLLWDEQEQIKEAKVKQGNDVINRDRMAADKDSYLVLLLKEQKSVYDKNATEERKWRIEEWKEDRRWRWEVRGQQLRPLHVQVRDYAGYNRYSIGIQMSLSMIN